MFDTYDMIVFLMYTAPSASPSSVMSTVINSTAITVSWSPLNQSATNGVIRHYKVSITNAVTESEEVLTTTTPNLTITMLTPFTQYSVRVAAFTIGSGPYSNPIYVMTAEDGELYILFDDAITFSCFALSAK